MEFIKDLRQQIKDRSFHKVYLLMGDEGYLIQWAKHALIDSMVEKDDTMNYQAYEMEKVNLDELSEQSKTYPFFSEKRVILLNNTGILSGDKDKLKTIFEELPDATCLIIVENEVRKNLASYKWINKNGYVVEALKKDLKDTDLKRYIAGWLKRAGKQIRGDDAGRLVILVGNDLYALHQEVDKLIAYTGDADVVTREDIEQVVTPRIEERIFDLMDAIASGDRKMVQKRYREMILLREVPMRILHMMVRQYRILLIVYDMERRREPDNQIAKTAGIRPFVLRKTKAQLRGTDRDYLIRSLDACLATEEQIKTGMITDQIGLETLLVELTEKILKNDK